MRGICHGETDTETSPRVIPTLVCRNPERKLSSAKKCLAQKCVSGAPVRTGNTIHAALAVGEALIIVQAEFRSSRVRRRKKTEARR